MAEQTTPLGPNGFLSATNVSRETLARLTLSADLLVKWQKAINLVGKSTLPDLWRRHMLDSYQLLSHTSRTKGKWIDLGSGAGFPPLVLAICSEFDVHALESDQRKCLFMTNVSRETSANLSVHRGRIEEIEPFAADVISARALAPLEKLLDLAAPFAHETTEFLFLKGQDVDEELTNASKCWIMDVEKGCSLTSEDGCILKITGLRRRSSSGEAENHE
ncbi:16S rRNA (guanine(527)-N(7))-methyltransferase RsmG [Sneathiella litorea]|uniref:Ribosomal RNA small subunit methyltransferase G n=1 Tax=Sneathiella litorea TaxID=2606216 RepID=A0A6L8W3X4_9PROT|nr:16S rRNA (guanine(527)-N(7))-methyltransferase RsmG [Sneathiella litorea]MZR29795.1 16S rRNA (guanine(527)-N(7))-methyltransferase RsmG [Sneathiella litorea]